MLCMLCRGKQLAHPHRRARLDGEQADHALALPLQQLLGDAGRRHLLRKAAVLLASTSWLSRGPKS